MPPSPSARRLSAALLLLATLLAPAAASTVAPPPNLLALRVNGVDLENEIEVLLLPHGPAVPREAWRRIGLADPPPAPVTVDGRAFHPIDRAGLRWTVDEPTQTLVLTAPASVFEGRSASLAAAGPSSGGSAGRGAFVNYDVFVQSAGRGIATQALLEAAAFGDGVSARHAVLVRDNVGLPSVRLDSQLAFEEPGRGSVLRLGDAIAEPGSWGRALRFAGLQWSSDFSLRPDLQTMAAPVIRGETVVPSTVDVLVDGGRRLQTQVGAGPFELTDVPVVNGRGEVRVAVRDLFGREQLAVLPYYASPALLRAGLSERSFEVGAVRKDYGVASQRYGRAFASATERRGLDGGWTRELRGEVSGRGATGGIGLAWPLPGAAGLARVGAVASRVGSRSGGLLEAAASHQSSAWSASVHWRSASRSFAQLGPARGTNPRTDVVLSASAGWHRVGFGATVVQRSDHEGRRSGWIAANASHRLGAASSLGVVVLHGRRTNERLAQLVFSVAVDARQVVSVAASGDRAGARQAVQWQRAAAEPGDLYLRALAEHGPTDRQQADVGCELPLAELTAGVSRSGRAIERRVGVAGSVAWAGDRVFAGRSIDDSFAVVQVADYAGVTVLLENRPVAATDARGWAFVPGLRGRESNRLSIDAGEIPDDAEVDAAERQVVPPARSGVVVSLPVRRTAAARFRLVDTSGTALPPGALGRVEGDGQRFTVGYDGLAYVGGLQRLQTATVQWPDGACRMRLEAPGGASPGPHDLGTLVCEPLR